MSDTQAKGTVEWNGRRITVEGPQDFVSAELARFRKEVTGEVALVDDLSEVAHPDDRPLNDAGFVEMKKPQSHSEKIAVLGARLAEGGTVEFDIAALRKIYIRAGVKPPQNLKQALIDTKNRYGYVEPGTTKGFYRLTDHGADFVHFDLPRKGAKK